MSEPGGELTTKLPEAAPAEKVARLSESEFNRAADHIAETIALAGEKLVADKKPEATAQPVDDDADIKAGIMAGLQGNPEKSGLLDEFWEKMEKYPAAAKLIRAAALATALGGCVMMPPGYPGYPGYYRNPTVNLFNFIPPGGIPTSPDGSTYIPPGQITPVFTMLGFAQRSPFDPVIVRQQPSGSIWDLFGGKKRR